MLTRKNPFYYTSVWGMVTNANGSNESWCLTKKTTTILLPLDRSTSMPSVLWHCWLGGRKGIRPVKNWVVGCWHGYLSGARCRLAYVPADAIATHCLLLSKIQTGFTFLVPAHPGSPGKRAVKWVCVHRSTCVSRHLQLKLEGLVGAEFYGLFWRQLKGHLFREAWTRCSVTSGMWPHRETHTYLLDEDVYWCHLANMTGWSVHGGDAALCQITLDTSYESVLITPTLRRSA